MGTSGCGVRAVDRREPQLSIALLVIGNGRLDYLHQAVDSVLEHCPQFDHYLMVDDSGDHAVCRELDRHYPDFTIHHHDTNQGMARAVQAGFDLVLATDAEYVVWWEEDFVAEKPIPVEEAVDVLGTYGYTAQMLFQRQPLTPQEVEAGSVAGAMGGISLHHDWIIHGHIFSLNPCVIPRRILERGWPAGNEREMTNRLLVDGYTFGVWADGPLVHHIGNVRGTAWQL